MLTLNITSTVTVLHRAQRSDRSGGTGIASIPIDGLEILVVPEA